MKPKCSVCNDDRVVRLVDSDRGVYRCDACPHMFKVIPRERQERYDESYFTDAHKNWFAHPDRKLYEYIYRTVIKLRGGDSVRLLDLGCGNGNFLRHLRSKGPAMELCGVDLASHDLPGVRFIRGDIMSCDVDGTYDVVTCLAVIEHVDTPDALVKRIRSLTNPGGLVFIMTDDDGSLIYRIARLLKRLGIRAAFDQLYELHHLQCFTRKSLSALMERNGYEVLYHMNHNYPVRGVDIPKTNRLMRLIYRAGASCIFLLSIWCGSGILQTIVCRNKGDDGER